MFKKYRFRDFDFRLVILVLLASSIGVMSVGSANENYVKSQMVGIAAGLVVMMIAALFDYTWILKLYWLMYAGIVGLLVLTSYSPLGAPASHLSHSNQSVPLLLPFQEI